jgi:succinate dehydrogenase / fumarate reductase, cytochrome b subunit
VNTTLSPRPSSVGVKALLALSGAVLFGWILLHLAGNLTLFAGAAMADGYAASLRRTGPLLWLARGVVLLAAGVHVWAAVNLARRAPPRSRLLAGRGRAATIASRTMRLGGLLLLLFVGYHLLHLTAGAWHADFLAGRVHHNVVTALSRPLVAAVYLGACGLLGLHLAHGLGAAGASLGLRPDRDPSRRRRLAAGVGTAVALLFASIPLAILLGLLS